MRKGLQNDGNNAPTIARFQQMTEMSVWSTLLSVFKHLDSIREVAKLIYAPDSKGIDETRNGNPEATLLVHLPNTTKNCVSITHLIR